MIEYVTYYYMMCTYVWNIKIIFMINHNPIYIYLLYKEDLLKTTIKQWFLDFQRIKAE